jgi:hypothetical protein
VRITVTWVGGAWFLDDGVDRQRIDGDRRWLDAWLEARGRTRGALDFGGSRALEQRFVSEFGPII